MSSQKIGKQGKRAIWIGVSAAAIIAFILISANAAGLMQNSPGGNLPNACDSIPVQQAGAATFPTVKDTGAYFRPTAIKSSGIKESVVCETAALVTVYYVINRDPGADSYLFVAAFGEWFPMLERDWLGKGAIMTYQETAGIEEFRFEYTFIIQANAAPVSALVFGVRSQLNDGSYQAVGKATVSIPDYFP